MLTNWLFRKSYKYIFLWATWSYAYKYLLPITQTIIFLSFEIWWKLSNLHFLCFGRYLPCHFNAIRLLWQMKFYSLSSERALFSLTVWVTCLKGCSPPSFFNYFSSLIFALNPPGMLGDMAFESIFLHTLLPNFAHLRVSFIVFIVLWT